MSNNNINKDFVNSVSHSNTSALGEKIYEAMDGKSNCDISYNLYTNTYTYRFRSDDVNLYSTADILYYYFGENLKDKEVQNKIYTISLSNGIDCITYEGVVIGFGASRDEAESAFTDAINSITVHDIEQFTESLPATATISGGTAIATNGNDKAQNTAFAAIVALYSTYHMVRASKGYEGTNLSDSSEVVSSISSLYGMAPLTNSVYGSFILSGYIETFLNMSDTAFMGRFLTGYNDGDILDFEATMVQPGFFKESYTDWVDKYADGSVPMDKIPWTDEELIIQFDYDGFKEKNSKWFDESTYEKMTFKDLWADFCSLSDKSKDTPIEDICDQIDKSIDSTNLPEHEKERLKEQMKKIFCTDEIKTATVDSLKDVKSSFTSAAKARVVYDPLIFDLDGDGFNIENKENGTHFDLDNNGFAEKINWTSKDGFLCLDLNGNGIIDNGGELFGDSTLLADGTKAKNGFEALAQYDSNGDGVIDKNDDIFESLRIWVDADGSGTSSEGEMKTLSELGISGIKLNYTVLNGETGTEAVLGNMATFIREDGTEGSAAELWVSSDLFDTTETLNVEISEEIAKLPDVRSIGNAHSLRTAMALDETGTLKGYVEEFVNSNNAAEKRQAVEKILYFICGAENIDSASRGGNMDARQLAVLETMLGENFTGVNGADPNTVAAPILKEAYNNLFNLYFTELIKETVLKEYLPLIRYSEDENGNKVINTELFDLVMDYTGRKNEETAAHIIGAASLYIDSLKASGYTYTGNFVEDYMKKSSTIAIGILGYTGMGLVADGENPLNGTASGEYLGGSVNNDEINAGEGDDILIGGKGDDILNGGKGCDTYVFNIGDGNDVVYDSHTYYYDARNDRIKFGEGITADSVNVRREDNSLIFEYGNGDMVTVKDHFASEYNSIEYVEFSNGDIITNNQIDKLIQAMASFEADSGMTWNEAIENNDKRASDIITEMWIKTA